VNDVLLLILAFFIAAVVVTLALTAFVAWRIWRSDERSLAKRIRRLPFRGKLQLGLGLFADRRAPSWARLLIVALILYLALPFDLIPDFIPLLGLVDDFVIVLFVTGLIIRSIPEYVLEEHLAEIERDAQFRAKGSREFEGTVISRNDPQLHDPSRHHR
jgi:uncharacterized membrane protein YkvA (DUF1232 family)